MQAPVTIPPGIVRVGTERQATGHWYDASLVRWFEGGMGPVGGWQTRVDTAAPTPRAIIAWADLSGDQRIALGNYNSLQAVSAAGVVTDITPAGLVAGTVDAEINTGYGGDDYGDDLYGTERASDGDYGTAATWSMDTWGEYLVACSDADGGLYEWQLDTALNAVAITNAPTGCKGLVVTEERFLMALGAAGNPRLVQWCDRENNTVWTPSATNEAGDLELQISGQIMCGARVQGQTLILTDTDAHTATYQGPPFVYGFARVGTACGIVSRKALAVVDEGAFWMGQRGFFVYRGARVEPLPSTVSDYVFGDISGSQQSKTFATANAQFGEIWWFYPSGAGLECDRYAVFNYRENHWTIGELARTCGVDRGVFLRPIMVDVAGVAYNHEFGSDHDGAAVFAESGPLTDGLVVQTLVRMRPDEQTQGDVTATFKTRFEPNGAEAEHGPYTMTAPTSLRLTGRLIRMRLDGARDVDWRCGVPLLEYQARGNR